MGDEKSTGKPASIQKPQARPTVPTKTLEQTIQEKLPSFREVATRYLTPERLVKLALVMVSRVPAIRECSQLSVVSELMTCARLGLEPGVEGGRWLVPFRNKKAGTTDLVGITDYRGLIDIARRSGEVLAVHADVRREVDVWEYWIDASGATLVHLRHQRAEGERGVIKGAYAIVKLRNGEAQAAYLPLDEINAIKARSKSARDGGGPWNDDWEAMAKKTALRRLYNLLPKTPEISDARAALADEDEHDRAEAAIDVTPSAADRPALKDRIKAAAGQTQDAPQEDRTLEPGSDPAAMDREPGQEG